MPKSFHEIRDPIYVFIRYDSAERDVIDSKPFQRLRHIHQLAMTHLLYPGATHRRFEHSLGVMELSSRVFDIITSSKNISSEFNEVLEDAFVDDKKSYWRRVLRMAALCHDLGHIPFSHATEDLLPDGLKHENLTYEIILSEQMRSIWDNMTPPLRAEDIAKLAVGPGVIKDLTFSLWEALLSEIIVGNAFGADRIDYLLRDSHHAGVMYGKFDHYRLIDTLRIIKKSEDNEEPTLGIEYGGIHSAEALLLARYFMFTQVYLHPIRIIYDIHLADFLKEWLEGGTYNTELDSFLNMTDNEVTVALLDAARNSTHNGHSHAIRIINRDHFRILYERNPQDMDLHLEPGRVIYEATLKEFGDGTAKHKRYSKESGALVFPVGTRDGRVVSSLEISETLKTVPPAAIDFVFIDIAKREPAQKWLKDNRQNILTQAAEIEEEE